MSHYVPLCSGSKNLFDRSQRPGWSSGTACSTGSLGEVDASRLSDLGGGDQGARRVSVALLVGVVLRVDLDIVRPLVRHLVVRKDGLNRTCRDAGTTINALVRMDVELLLRLELVFVLPGMDAIDRTDVNTGCVFRTNAGLTNGECY